MKDSTTSDHDECKLPDHNRGCLRHVLLWCVQQFHRSSLLARYSDVSVFPIPRISSGIFLGPINPQVRPKRHTLMDDTTSDHDERRIPDLNKDSPWHVLLWCIQQFRRAVVYTAVPPVISSRPIYRWVRVFDAQNLCRHFWCAQQPRSAPEKRLVGDRHHERSRPAQDTSLHWGLSTAYAAGMCAAVPPIISSRPIYRRVRVLDTQDLCRNSWGAHQAQRASENLSIGLTPPRAITTPG